MRHPRVRFTIGRLMVAVAVAAGFLAWRDLRVALALIGLFLVVIVPAAIAPPRRRLEAASWGCLLQPAVVVLYLYATWVTAWCVLGHCPRPSLDDPKYISPVVEAPYVMFAFSAIIGWHLYLQRPLADGGLQSPSIELLPSLGPSIGVAGGLPRADIRPARRPLLVHGLSRSG